MRNGFEIDLIKRIADEVSVPVIACGGAGSVADIEYLLNQTDVSAVACASIFHYDILTVNGVLTTA